MERFIVSARKYRPGTFDSVVGQSHITTTLKNAIKSGKLAQAFLFCGPRGVGKTTNARILAKAINCFRLTEDTEPCNACESCVSFNNGQSLNILELDAASNNKVEDIRELVEQVRFVPTLGKYKVFIIDEVHMLTTQAFNAFLKTLEEPPAHAIFILATTEKHKIIPTILSRCQIFDFNRIRVKDIADHLQRIAEKEQVQAEYSGLEVIARKSDGALRDALSMFDQMVTFTSGQLTYKSVIANLHLLDYERYISLCDSMIAGDHSSVLLQFDGILAEGFENIHFVGGLASHFRNLLVSREPSTLELMDVPVNVRQEYQRQAQLFPINFLIHAIGICTRAEASCRSALNARLNIELALLQLCANASAIEAEKKKPERIEGSPTVDSPAAGVDKAPAVAPDAKQEAPEQAPAAPQVVQEKKASLFAPPPGMLKEAMANKDASTAVRGKIIEQENPFTEEAFRAVWLDYAAEMNKSGKSALSTVMQNAELKHGSDFIFSFSVGSALQVEWFNEVRTEMLIFLRTKLANDKINFQIDINKVETEHKPYTNAEKFKWMAKQNPNLENLRKQLDLEI